jgi:hypothetical protein
MEASVQSPTLWAGIGLLTARESDGAQFVLIGLMRVHMPDGTDLVLLADR